MAWSDLTITRDDIDAFEKQTFRDVNVTTGNTVLNLDEDDNLTVDRAKNMLEADVVDHFQDYINDDTYANDVALLDAIEAVDERDLLANLLTYKFLELFFFQDATHADSKSMVAAKKYNSMYQSYLRINLARLGGNLSSVKTPERFKFQSSYASY